MQRYTSARRSEHSDVRPRVATVRHALDRLLDHTAIRVRDGIRSVATLTMQRRHRRWLLDRIDPVTPIEALTSPVLVELLEGWVLGGGEGGAALKIITVAKLASTLRRALRLAAERGELDRLPLFPEFGRPAMRPRVRILRTVAELRRLMDAVPVHRAEWIAVAVWTCQRPSDVERMRWCDVDLAAPSMIVRSTKTRRPHGIRVAAPTPIVDVLIARRERLTAAGTPPAATDPLVDPWPNVSCCLPAKCARLGLPPLSAVDLRHTGFSWMVRKTGLTPGAVAWGGWSDFNMLQRYYAHALPPQLADCAEALSSMTTEISVKE